MAIADPTTASQKRPERTVEALTQLGRDWDQITHEVGCFFRDLHKLKSSWLGISDKTLKLGPIQFQDNYLNPPVFWTYETGSTFPFAITVAEFLAGPDAVFNQWRETRIALEEGDRKAAEKRARQREIEERKSLEELSTLVKRYPDQAKICLERLHGTTR